VLRFLTLKTGRSFIAQWRKLHATLSDFEVLPEVNHGPKKHYELAISICKNAAMIRYILSSVLKNVDRTSALMV
jgi:hypothetical protein